MKIMVLQTLHFFLSENIDLGEISLSTQPKVSPVMAANSTVGDASAIKYKLSSFSCFGSSSPNDGGNGKSKQRLYH